MLPLMEAFYTIQGEGHFTGTPAYFVRIGGCDVGCHWCDVMESWDASKHPPMSCKEISMNALDSGALKTVVTGGEPLMYDLKELTFELAEKRQKRHLETSGAYPLTGNWEWICFSPKKFKKPLDEFYELSHELKVIIFNKSDFKWAESHGSRMHKDAILYLQPEWSKEKEMIPLIVDYIKKNPKWRISLQTHKYMDIP